MSFNHSTKWSASSQTSHLSISSESSVNPSINPPISHIKAKWNQIQVGSLPPKYDVCGKCARNLDTHIYCIYIYIYIKLCLLLPLKWQRPSKTVKECSPENKPWVLSNPPTELHVRKVWPGIRRKLRPHKCSERGHDWGWSSPKYVLCSTYHMQPELQKDCLWFMFKEVRQEKKIWCGVSVLATLFS